MAVVRREIEKKRRHKPIRQLIKEAGTAILAIKPVFMMSPISVAQYLEPGSVTFDLLLIDEASQVSPVDALGAMARARQVVVVGDDKQLPPTRFFSKMLDEDDVRGRRRRRPQRRRPGEHPRALRRPGDVAADAPLALPQPPPFADRRLEPRVLREPPLRRPEPDDDHGDARAPLPPRQGRRLRPGQHGDEPGRGPGDRRGGHRAREAVSRRSRWASAPSRSPSATPSATSWRSCSASTSSSPRSSRRAGRSRSSSRTWRTSRGTSGT